VDREINKVEYQIRKFERGIKVAHKNRLLTNEPGVDYNLIISNYIGEIKELRDRLERLTEKKCFSSGRWKILVKGRRQPSIPKWPV
jgi:hypothetical protein